MMLELLAAAAIAFSIDNVTVRETNFDTVAVVTATLAAPSSEPVTVQYATADGTADATDYVPASGVVTFAPGATTARIPIFIKGDALDEEDETFFVDVDGVRGTVTIVDDLEDRLPVRVVAATVAARWQVQRRYTRATRLVVRGAPAIASIDVACSGGGCPFRFKTASRNLTPLFVGAKLRPRAVVQVTVDVPGELGKRFRFKMRAGKPPVRSVRVLD